VRIYQKLPTVTPIPPSVVVSNKTAAVVELSRGGATKQEDIARYLAKHSEKVLPELLGNDLVFEVAGDDNMLVEIISAVFVKLTNSDSEQADFDSIVESLIRVIGKAISRHEEDNVTSRLTRIQHIHRQLMLKVMAQMISIIEREEQQQEEIEDLRADKEKKLGFHTGISQCNYTLFRHLL
jgi:hypothetical protein